MKAILRNAVAGVAIASIGFASAASAATTDSADVTAEILTALSVDVVDADDTLDFGTVADGGINGPTNVTVGTNDNRTFCGTDLICGGTVNSPTFDVTGLAGYLVNISFPSASVTLTNPAPGALDGDMLVNAFTTNAVGNQVTLTAGVAQFRLGGTLVVDQNQAPGVYTGAVSVEVAYN